MKIQQENDGFSPIAIVLETREEASIFWDMVKRVKNCSVTNDKNYQMAVKISDWLSNDARL